MQGGQRIWKVGFFQRLGKQLKDGRLRTIGSYDAQGTCAYSVEEALHKAERGSKR